MQNIYARMCPLRIKEGSDNNKKKKKKEPVNNAKRPIYNSLMAVCTSYCHIVNVIM